MINLIPPAARKAVTKEYWLRVLVVWMLLAAAALVIVGILKIPAYVLTTIQSDAYSQQFDNAKAKQDEFKKSEALITTANQEAVHLTSFATSTQFFTYIEKIDQLSGSGITVTQFSFRQVEGLVGEILLSGQATTRSGLITFKDSITADPLFTDADLPIQNLATEKDIAYTMTLTPSNDLP